MSRRIVSREPARNDNGVYHYPSRDHRPSASPPDDWRSSEQSGVGISRRTGPVHVREIGPGQPAVASSPPSRPIYRGTAWSRGIDYIREGDPGHITTASPGDLHNRGSRASYWTTSEGYADYVAQRAGREHTGGMVLQQRVPSTTLDRAYCFPAVPGPDFNETVYHNRAQLRSPRATEAVARSRQAPHVMAPTSGRETRALLRETRDFTTPESRSEPQFTNALRIEREPSSSDDSDLENRRYVQQIRFQDDAIDDLAALPRHGRPARPPRRR